MSIHFLCDVENCEESTPAIDDLFGRKLVPADLSWFMVDVLVDGNVEHLHACTKQHADQVLAKDRHATQIRKFGP